MPREAAAKAVRKPARKAAVAAALPNPGHAPVVLDIAGIRLDEADRRRLQHPLTGGHFGLDSSLIAFRLCTTSGVVLLLLAVRRGHVVPGIWAR